MLSHAWVGITNFTSELIASWSWLGRLRELLAYTCSETILWNTSFRIIGKALYLIISWVLFEIWRCLKELSLSHIPPNLRSWKLVIVSLSLIIVRSRSWSILGRCIAGCCQSLTNGKFYLCLWFNWLIFAWSWLCPALERVNERLHSCCILWTHVSEWGLFVGSWSRCSLWSECKSFLFS